MFKIDYILKTENIVIDNGEKEPVRVSLSINQNDAEIYVVVNDMNTIEHYWFFDIKDHFGKYFDIRNVIDFAITKSNDVNEFVGMLNEVFSNEYYNELLGSSFFNNECEECADKDNCEEYLKHKN